MLRKAVKVHMPDIAKLEVEACMATEKPITGLSVTITEIIEKSQLNCKKTLKLIQETIEDDREFILNLVTEQLREYPHVQLHFLKTFIITNLRLMQKTIAESAELDDLRAKAEFYEKMLVLFIRRLCESDKEADNVEHWVSLEIFPTRRCMEECRKFRNYSGEAFLMEKLGDGLKAIQIYLKMID